MYGRENPKTGLSRRVSAVENLPPVEASQRPQRDAGCGQLGGNAARQAVGESASKAISAKRYPDGGKLSSASGSINIQTPNSSGSRRRPAG